MGASALTRASGRREVFTITLLSIVAAIDEFTDAIVSEVSAERWHRIAREPTAKASVLRHSAWGAVFEFSAVHRAFDFIYHVQERAEVAGGEVVAHALENVQDLVVRDVAIVVWIGLLVECGEGLFDWHRLLLCRLLWLEESA